MTQHNVILIVILSFIPVSVEAIEKMQCGSYETCKPLAVNGNAAAQFYMGYVFHYGKGTDVNFSKAMMWYQKAAMQKHMGAQINSSHMCSIDKTIIAKEKKKIIESWIKLATNNPVFQNCLGNLYHNGTGISIDNKRAAVWYKKVADLGYADAQFNLGHMLYSGLGIKKDTSSGENLLEAASNQGHPKAIESLKTLEK